MPNKARVGIDNAGGGLITGPGAPTVLVNGVSVACVGDTIASHSPFTGLHTHATIATGSTTVFAGGRAVARLGDLATCGHTITPGSTNVFAN